MLTKSDPDEIQSYLVDASYLPGGSASQVAFPESVAEVGEVLAAASASGTPVTISGAGTGTVAGRVPFGGIVLATDRLNQILRIDATETGGRAVAEAGVVLRDLQQAAKVRGLLYPPDPTERSCFLGGTIATNASGSRTFKYGPTRNYIERLKIVLASGEVLDLRRGELFADAKGLIEIPLPSGRTISARLPSYRMPHVRKHASGYYVAPEMDVLDLFIGSEGTLGVIVEAEVRLLRQPEALLSGVVFFATEDHLLAFVREARERSLKTRQISAGDIDARALEYFDTGSLEFLRQKYPNIPHSATGAVFFEQEISASSEEELQTSWLALMEEHKALSDESWFAVNPEDHNRLREFRHQLPVLMNEWFARYRQKKVSTDMSVPDDEFGKLLSFYQNELSETGLRYTIFGHIGDNHVHVNILPRDDREAAIAREVYLRFVRRAVGAGGTISAEHGIGKLKREYLREMYSETQLREMAELKRAFDPKGILGQGNIFAG